MRSLAYPAVLVVVLLLVAQPMFVIPSVAYISRPSITIYDLTPGYYNIQLPMTSSKKLQFATNISVYNPSDVHLEVTLTPSGAEGWDINVTPDQMVFNASGRQKAVVTVIIPGDVNTSTELQIRLEASGWYPNMTEPLDVSTYSSIYLEQQHSLDVTYRFVNKDQYSNRIEFDVKNKGSGNEFVQAQYFSNGYMDGNLEVHFENNFAMVEPNGPPITLVLTARYSGSAFPKTYTLEIRFYPQRHSYYGLYLVSTNVTVSFQRPDTTQQNYLFVGAIGAFVIVMVVVMVLVLRGPSKGKK